MTATWSAKPIKEKKSDEVFQKLIFRIEELVFKNLELPIPEIPTLPAKMALTPKPNKNIFLQHNFPGFHPNCSFIFNFLYFH